MKRGIRLPLALRALSGQLGAQWERERRDTLFLMAPVLVATLPHLGWLPWWVGAGFIVLFAWRLGLLFSGRWLPRPSVGWAAALASTAAVWAHYGTLIGREPGVALLVLFLGLKLMEMRAKRDLFVVIFLSLFLLLAAFLHSQSIATAAIVLIGLAGLLSAMLTMQYRSHEASILHRFRIVGALMLQALPLAAVIFVLFPRPGGPLWGLPGDASRASTGLSESMTPGTVAELAESHEVAFRVEFEGPAPPPARLYWRGPVFGDFDGSTWRALPHLTPTSLAPELRVDASQAVGYTVIQEPTGRPWLFLLEMPVEIAMPRGFSATVRPDLQGVARSALNERIRFRARSSWVWQTGMNESLASLHRWSALPAGFNPRTLALAARWRNEGERRDRDPDPAPDRDSERDPGNAGSPVNESAPGNAPSPVNRQDAGSDRDLRLVDRALAMFREQAFRYTLRPPRLGRDSVDDFLFGQRAGFCEHFAGSFVVLMRALGIPARVVTGYQGGERNPVDGWWLVRQADAHAWAEVWITERGWLRVDPTAAVAPERIERGARLESRLAAGADLDAAVPLLALLRFYRDSVVNAWNQWLLSYDGDRQQRLFERLGLGIDDWRAVAASLALALTLVLSAIAIVTLHPRSARDPVQRAWDDFCGRLARASLARSPHETAQAYLRRIEPLLEPELVAQATRIVSIYNALRYGCPATTDFDPATRRHHVRHLRRCVSQFRP